MRALFTGSRAWADTALVQPIIDALPSDATVVVGDARGLDTLVAELAKARGLQVEVHRANWHRFGRGAGPQRNQEMVSAGADRAWAFPRGVSAGTRDCMRRIRAAGIPLEVIEG